MYNKNMMNKKGFNNLSLRGAGGVEALDRRGNLGFTLIELLVVVLIIAILGAIALPKYMVARDRAHLSGLITIGKNINDALDRKSLSYSSTAGSALNLLDISFKDAEGTDCDSSNLDNDDNYGTCRIKVSGKDYFLRPRLNSGGLGRSWTSFYPYANNAFGILYVYTESYANTYNAGYRFRLDCDYVSMNPDVDETRCVKLANSLGATCSVGDDYCEFN